MPTNPDDDHNYGPLDLRPPPPPGWDYYRDGWGWAGNYTLGYAESRRYWAWTEAGIARKLRRHLARAAFRQMRRAESHRKGTL